MKLNKLAFYILLVVVFLTGCSASKNEVAENGTFSENSEIVTEMNQVDMTKWKYEKDSDVYWQTGIVYCENPADENYETLGIYVPGAYMNATDNGDGTYKCEINASGELEGFTADTAPIVIPVDTPGYAAMNAPTGYTDQVSSYTDAGLIYVYAGCRGRDAGAPAGVTDLKAAIRYIRYNEDLLPGNTERIFSFGMSGGGAQSALLGATGDSDLYTPYLKAIGAVDGVSDAVAGSMCWCPITCLDTASEAYEWNLGVTRTGLATEMQTLSDEMAEDFALYINELGLKDEKGNPLTLTASQEGIYQAGSYYDYIKSTIETSLNHFLEDTTFPYTVSENGFGGFPKMGEEGPDAKDDKSDRPVKANIDKMDLQGKIEDRDGVKRENMEGDVQLSGTYETPQDYIDVLNQEDPWITYDSETNTASITSVADFVSALKTASKDVGAFDALDESQAENILFGDGDGQGDHFDERMAKLLKDTDYSPAFEEDLLRLDSLGVSVADRVNMYNPLYYLTDYYEGKGTSNVAPYWRIRSGINQSDTSLSTEVNLALALENYGADVDFETVWGQAHIEAERTGNSTANFIEWVKSCCK